MRLEPLFGFQIRLASCGTFQVVFSMRWRTIRVNYAEADKVAHGCERVSSNGGGEMATARRRTASNSKYVTAKSAPKDPTHGFPIQVSLPDGETSHHTHNPSLRHNGGPDQEAEMIRGYLKPPENKSVSDVEGLSAVRPCLFGGPDDWSPFCAAVQPPPHRSCGTAPLPHHGFEAYHGCTPHHCVRGGGEGGSSGGGSPRGRKAVFQVPFLPNFLSAREKGSHDGGARRQGRSGGTRGQCAPHYPVFRNPATTALADIAVVPCGAADPPPQYASDHHSDPMYGHTPADIATQTMEDDPPPGYSDVIDNPSLYRPVNRTERRTNRGKI